MPHTYLEILRYSLIFSFSYQVMRNHWSSPTEEVRKISGQVRSWSTIR